MVNLKDWFKNQFRKEVVEPTEPLNQEEYQNNLGLEQNIEAEIKKVLPEEYHVRGLIVKKFPKKSRHKLLLIRERNNVAWSLPGGRCDISLEGLTDEQINETCRKELNRELSEELGLKDVKLKPFENPYHFLYSLFHYDCPSNCFTLRDKDSNNELKVLLYHVEEFNKDYNGGSIKSCEEKIEELGWFSSNNLKNPDYLIWNITRYNIRKAINLASLFIKNSYVSRDLSNGYKLKRQ